MAHLFEAKTKRRRGNTGIKGLFCCFRWGLCQSEKSSKGWNIYTSRLLGLLIMFAIFSCSKIVCLSFSLGHLDIFTKWLNVISTSFMHNMWFLNSDAFIVSFIVSDHLSSHHKIISHHTVWILTLTSLFMVIVLPGLCVHVFASDIVTYFKLALYHPVWNSR